MSDNTSTSSLGTFITNAPRKEHNLRKKLSCTLIAAAGAGLLASTLLLGRSSNTTDLPEDLTQHQMMATAKILNRCNINLMAIQLPSVNAALDNWSTVWLASSQTMPIESQEALCTQLISASLQGPSDEDTSENIEFLDALTETTQLMVAQISEQVLKDETIAESVGPLMGLDPPDVQKYFKSVKKYSPPENKSPTSDEHSHFNV